MSVLRFLRSVSYRGKIALYWYSFGAEHSITVMPLELVTLLYLRARIAPFSSCIHFVNKGHIDMLDVRVVN